MKTSFFVYISILIITLTFSCFSCSKEVKLEGNLLLVDSLNWEENPDHVMGNIVSVKSYKNKIYIIEGDRISVFDFKSLKYIQSFGKQGSAPGEFKAAFDLCIIRDTIYVCDTANSRIQKFTLTGDYIDSFRYPLPFSIQAMEDTLYVMNYFKRPDLRITKIKNDSILHEMKIGKMIEDKGMSKYYKLFRVFKDKLILTFINNTEYKMFYASDSTLTQFDCINNPDISEISACNASDGKFYMIAVHKDNNNPIETESSGEHKKHLGMIEYLYVYDENMKLVKIYRIPDHILTSLSTLEVKDDFVLITDAFSSVIYKLKMVN